MFHPSHWFHTHKHNKCLFPFDVCAFEDYKGKHANRELSFKRGDIIQVSGQCQDDGGNPIDVPRKPTKLSSGIMDVNCARAKRHCIVKKTKISRAQDLIKK